MWIEANFSNGPLVLSDRVWLILSLILCNGLCQQIPVGTCVSGSANLFVGLPGDQRRAAPCVFFRRRFRTVCASCASLVRRTCSPVCALSPGSSAWRGSVSAPAAHALTPSALGRFQLRDSTEQSFLESELNLFKGSGLLVSLSVSSALWGCYAQPRSYIQKQGHYFAD